jgi:hypothetical protein
MAERIFRRYGNTDSLCVVDEGLIKLGGSALGIVAENALADPGDDPPRARISGLAKYVVSQREPDGSFLPARVPGGLPRPHPLRDAFSTGQAIMGLAVASQATNDPAYLALAIDSLDRLAARDYLVGTAAHCMLYAIEAVERTTPSDARRAYARRLALGILQADLPDESIPIACASEGLLAYARMLHAQSGADEAVREVLARVEVNLRRQARFFHPSGAFVTSAAKHEVRIDTVMHNLLGFLGWARLMEAVADYQPGVQGS